MHPKIESGSIAWRSPSNIALVKYWGKKPVQIPANPSLSMTLSKACTELYLDFSPKTGKTGTWLEFLFEGKKQDNFEKKIAIYLRSLMSEFPALTGYYFKISTTNTFPHSTGIASSASSMSALGLCLADFIAITGESEFPPGFSRSEMASYLSRLASGSASRSVYGGYVIWGRVPELAGTSDNFAITGSF